MSFSILISIVIGILSAMFILPESFKENTDLIITISLNLLILSVGIDLGSNKRILSDLKQRGLSLLLVPFGVIAGSLFGGFLSGLIFDMSANTSGAIAAGFGWYSLSGIILTDIASAEIGAIAFLSNVFRELIAVISIPIIAKYINHYAAIAPAGATSMDTTLPIISNSTKPEIVVVAFFNGAILSTLVPILVPFIYSF